MRQATKLLGWSLIVGLLVVGAFFAGRHVPGDGMVAAAGAPAAARGELARMGATADAAGAPMAAATGAQRLPHVWFILGPGTIPRNPSDRLNYLRYSLDPAPRLTGEEMLAFVPEIANFARVTVDEENPWEFDTAVKLGRLAMHINAVLARSDVVGLIVGHGTNTIEETAYWLNLTVKSDKPVVIVGSQRPMSTLSSDGPLNLLNAIRVAGDAGSRGKGVLVLLNDEITAARDVTKTNTYRVETFQSREFGFLGYADPDQIIYYRAPMRAHTRATEFNLATADSFPKVSVLYAHAGGDDTLVHAAVAAGAQGLVIAGTGAGSTQDMRRALADYAQQGIVVVRASRLGAGRVVRDDNYQEPDFVAADNLNPQKAWVLLTLALTRTSDPDTIQRMFDRY
jgi:L-asparaginase